YDAVSAHRFWKILSLLDVVFKRHRAHFDGRTTPVHFFWGSFDLALTRFSGKRLATPTEAGVIRAFSATHEQIAAGWWPGNEHFPEPAFFSYAYPKPDGLEEKSIRPAPAGWNPTLGEFVLRYDDVRTSPN